MADSELRFDALEWGRGSRVFEAFLEPTCPYSARSFDKLFEALAQAGEDKGTLKIRLHSQPWHLFSRVEMDKPVRWHTKYARQNGIHVSPTFMVDGIVQPDMSSGDSVEDWVKRLA